MTEQIEAVNKITRFFQLPQYRLFQNANQTNINLIYIIEMLANQTA